MGTCIAYIRRSVVDGDNPGEVSQEQQLARCRELARAHGCDEPEILVDWGKSGGEGKEHRRPAYLDLKGRVKAGSVSWIVAYDLSRLSRSTKETIELVDLARANGARIHVGDLGILDPEDPVGRYIVTGLAGANTLLRDLASRRGKQLAAERKAAGLAIGAPPYGDRAGESAQAVAAAFQEAGSYHAAARLLNARGIRPRRAKGWEGSSVRRVVLRLDPASTATARRRVRSKGRHALTGLLRCHCGAAMRLLTTRWQPQAVCPVGLTDPSHPRPTGVSQDKLMPWVRAEAARLRVPGDTLEAEQRDEAARTALMAKRGRLLDAYEAGMVDRDDFQRRTQRVIDEIEALDRRTVALAIPPAIDWTWPPDRLNPVLRALWQSIALGPDLLPVSAEWAVPEWRAA